MVIRPTASRQSGRSGAELMQLIGRRALDASTLTQPEEAALRAHVKARVTAFRDQLCNRLQAAASGGPASRTSTWP